MDFHLITYNETCYQLIHSIVPVNPIYYAHVSTAIVAFLLGWFVFIKSGKSLLGKLLLTVALSFSLWSLFDLLSWVSYDTRVIMFSWGILGILSGLIFLSSFYFSYVFIFKKDLHFWLKIALVALFVPVVLFTPTAFNLTHFDISSCESAEGTWFTNYYQFFGLGIALLTLLVNIHGYRRTEKKFRRQVLLFTFGIEFFLLAFVFADYIASLTGNYLFLIYGLFGMPVFMGFLVYLIVQYKAFNIHLLKAQALVVSLVLLIGAEFFFVNSRAGFILTGVTFMFAVLFGGSLISSVRRDEERKDQLQRMADHLASANDKLRELDNAKSEFISIASHQLRTPLTAIKGYISLILEGAYGKTDAVFTEVLDKVYISNERLIQLVENLLNISRMESGRMQYRFEEASLNKILSETVDAFFLSAKNKHLELKLLVPENPFPPMQLDVQKIQEALSNLIDNALKYTKEGGVTVKAEDLEKSVRVTVQDTGIGVPASELPNLFNKFSRGKDIGRLHATGTGLGLYVVKNLVEAHGGMIHIESEGEGKGSKFVIDLPKEEKARN